MSSEDWIEAALEEIKEKSQQESDGKWLERLTIECAPLIKDWDIEKCWKWEEWPEIRQYYQSIRDLGIDIVARRRSDGKYIAIQCKSRKLSVDGKGAAITLRELSSFKSLSASKWWAERWVVTNGNVSIGDNVAPEIDPEKPVKLFNLKSELLKHQQVSWSLLPELRPDPGTGGLQTRDCMQEEAVSKSVRILREMANGPTGRARGRIILPCGTGKSRIALRIIEELTQGGEVSAVLCPSIALVAQLRREFLTHAQRPIRAIAVCSDDTAGSGSDLSADPTLDISQTSASEVKGLVTTDPAKISEWMDEVAKGQNQIGVIFSTYQSSHQIATALANSNQELSTVVADEAHRTAGLRRIPKLEKKLRDFTVCHDEGRFPAKFRVYQTATPRVYNLGKHSKRNNNWIVRTMDDQAVFGVELYRKSYVDAVTNEWLSNYRIIALGVNDQDAFDTANNMAAESDNKLSVTNSLRGLALALVMGGALRKSGTVIASSINFVNTIKKSKEMTRLLKSKEVREWVQHRLTDAGIGGAANYDLEHLDAKSKVAAREEAKARLAAGTEAAPHGIINVGIFGEGTDAPSLSAVGFLEARKSPVDVIQAVGRVMRRSPGKERGYIICPIVIPPGTDAETWLRNSGPEDGWKELGQILVALRAHDSRIEDELSDLIEIYVPSPPPENVATMVTLGREENRAEHFIHDGKPGEVVNAVEEVLKGASNPEDKFVELDKVDHSSGHDPERIVSGKLNEDKSIEIREDGVERDKPKTDGTPGAVNIERSKDKGKNMLHGKVGRKVDLTGRKPPKPERIISPELFDRADTAGITVNLLERSGLIHDRAKRDVNILQDSIEGATEYLRQDELGSVLDKHFRLDALDAKSRKKQADGCTIASLLLMNAAMLHQRIAAGRWLPNIESMDKIKNSVNAFTKFYDQWSNITRHDFLPVMDPAIEVIRVIRDSGRLEGLNRSLRHLASEAEHIAESYADLGADHAGPLFNKVMGNQASDGAYFSRPPVASLLAKLVLDVSEKKSGGGGELDARQNVGGPPYNRSRMRLRNATRWHPDRNEAARKRAGRKYFKT
ncbi:MAG: DEAD/DEAH box helicase family protein [Bacteroidota bacterium]|nr:DEAD/DEAH box helicase family protein [Bacteroidota bacterium]